MNTLKISCCVACHASRCNVRVCCRLLELLCPACSVMDLNIGAALWLAARAQGILHLPTFSNCPMAPPATPTSSSSHGQLYCSCARVVLLGHGADEVFAGYGRHRTAFRVGGLLRLQAELELDMQRLWLRNLGRDDRLIADCSRESRHPFLDEALLATVAAQPLTEVADLQRPAGQGDKAVLRGVAQRLGLVRAAGRVKRAIQFGTRIGKQSNVRDFGSNRAANKMRAGTVVVRTSK
jgi:asparagine synthetase B (glutamine-hydrolysing)